MNFRCVCVFALKWYESFLFLFIFVILILFALHRCKKGSLCFRFCTLIVKRKEQNAVLTHQLNFYRLRLEKGIEEKEEEKKISSWNEQVQLKYWPCSTFNIFHPQSAMNIDSTVSCTGDNSSGDIEQKVIRCTLSNASCLLLLLFVANNILLKCNHLA